MQPGARVNHFEIVSSIGRGMGEIWREREPVEPERPATSINVVINWFDELQQRGLAAN
jgi:hypothetical protein